jgi:hypothetical protein
MSAESIPLVKYLPSGTKPIFERSNLTLGTTSDQPVPGVKELRDCQESWLSAYTQGRAPKTFALCWAGVVGSGTVVCPIWEKDIIQDLRASRLEVLRMWTENGDECVSGMSPRYRHEYRVGHWYEGRCEDEVTQTCVPGFHFWHSRYAAGPSFRKNEPFSFSKKD